MAEFITEANLNSLFTKTAPTLTVELVGTAPVNNRNEFFWLAIGY